MRYANQRSRGVSRASFPHVSLRFLLFVAIAVLIPHLVFAQDGTIRGTVSDASAGDPLPGVNVIVQGTLSGAATDLEGRYEIRGVAPGQYTLVATFIGFKQATVQVTLGPGATVEQNIVLEEDFLGLEEIVVTGQGGAIQKKRLSTTIEVITPAQIEATPGARLEGILQAQLPNAQIRLNSGQPGVSSLIRSRGPTSATGITTPVIYIDGVRVDNRLTAGGDNLAFGTGGARSSAISDIPVENIERIEFIKGGAATTLYGSDAAAGVIQIFTKQGIQGRNNLFFETELGAVSGTEDFLRFDRTGDIFYRPGFVQSYTLAGSGGTEQFTYSFSGKMQDDNGFRRNNESVRYDVRSTFAARPSDNVRYTSSFGLVSHQFNRDYNANTSFSQFQNVEGGDFGIVDTLNTADYEELRDRLRSVVDLVDIEADIKRFQTSQALEYNPFTNVTAKFTAGLDYRVSQEKEIRTNEFLVTSQSRGEGTIDQGLIQQFERRFLGLTLEGTVQHRGELGFASFVTTVGGQVFRDEDRQSLLEATNVTEGSESINNAAEQTSEDFVRQVANYGVFVNENIGLGNRLFFDLGFRVDGNSAFGAEAGAQFYPRAGVAYTISEERFFHNVVPRSLISNLKLRANFGAAGRFPTPFANDRLIGVNPYLGVPSYTFDQPGNLDLKPEKVFTWEVGGDIGLINERVSLEVTYYNATTQDAIFTAPFASSTGQDNQERNIGEIVNKGFEIASTFYLVSSRNWDVTFNGSLNTLDNEVTDNGGTAPFSNGGFSFLGTWVDEGQPVAFLRGNQPIFDDAGNLVDAEENVFLGDPNPELFGSLGLSARYKNLNLFVTADYQTGAQGVAVDDVLRFFGGVQDEGRIPTDSEGNITVGPSDFFDLAGLWVEDTDYLKVRLISLSYDLPRRLMPQQIRSLRIGASVTNPFNFVNSSFDPEVSGNSGGEVGGVFGFGTESPPRRFLFNLRLGF